jgi:hypothetical protein
VPILPRWLSKNDGEAAILPYCCCTPVRPHPLRGRMDDVVLLLKQSDTVTVVFCGACQRINATSTHPPRFLRPMMRVLNKHEHSKLIRQRQTYYQRLRKLNYLFFIAVLHKLLYSIAKISSGSLEVFPPVAAYRRYHTGTSVVCVCIHMYADMNANR